MENGSKDANSSKKLQVSLTSPQKTDKSENNSNSAHLKVMGDIMNKSVILCRTPKIQLHTPQMNYMPTMTSAPLSDSPSSKMSIPSARTPLPTSAFFRITDARNDDDNDDVIDVGNKDNNNKPNDDTFLRLEHQQNTLRRRRLNSMLISNAISPNAGNRSLLIPEEKEQKPVPPIESQKMQSPIVKLHNEDTQYELEMCTLLSEFNKQLEETYSSDAAYIDSYLPDRIVESLRHINTSVHQVTDYLSANLNSMESEKKSNVDSLINWNRLHWDFDNEIVKRYREKSQSLDFSTFDYKEWTMPRYLDNAPLPYGSSYALVQVGCFGKRNTLSVCVSDTADGAIAVAVEHFGEKGDPSDYVLKVLGYAEYIYGDELLYSFRFIRLQLRSPNKVRLMLIPKVFTIPPSPRPCFKKIPVKATHDLSKKTMNNFDCLFYVIVHNLENCNSMVLPLMDNSITHLYVTMFLLHGTNQMKGTVRMTPSAGRLNPSWNTKLKGHGRNMLKEFPRETRLVFILNGTKDGKKSQMLAYGSRQLIDEDGVLLQGPQEMNLWHISKAQYADMEQNIGKAMSVIREQYNYQKAQRSKTIRTRTVSKATLGMGRSEKKLKGITETKDALPLHFIYESSNRDNLSTRFSVKLKFSLPVYKRFSKVPDIYPYLNPNPREVGLPLTAKQMHRQNDLEKLLKQDYLYYLTENDKLLLWTVRLSLIKIPRVLPLFLLCVSWDRPAFRHEAHRLLKKWKRPTPVIAMVLLRYIYQDTTVRRYAVACLRGLTDSELQLYLPQLVQCLKAEPYHRSALADFLVMRAIASPLQVGHFFFWHMKSELDDAMHCERYALILEVYLNNCPTSSQRLRQQNDLILQLAKIAENIVHRARAGSTREENEMFYFRELEKLNKIFFKRLHGDSFELPINPSLEIKSIIVDKCSFMSSKDGTLLLMFENADEGTPPVVLIFKLGGDLRQDILTLQLLKVMDRMWLQTGYNMQLTTYSVMSTGTNFENKKIGMIEFVHDSDTSAAIQMKYGGDGEGTYIDSSIINYLKESNPELQNYHKSIGNFTHSCAGYVVLSSVLGLGERHNGNIMVTKDGRLFHTNFGHFLGNFKTTGIKRERVPFIFTPDMAYVFEQGGQAGAYKEFQELCCDGLNILRKPNNVMELETLCVLMVPAKMPELQMEQDLFYLKGRLRLDLNDKKAKRWMQKEIQKCKNTKWNQLNDVCGINTAE